MVRPHTTEWNSTMQYFGQNRFRNHIYFFEYCFISVKSVRCIAFRNVKVAKQ